MDNQWLGWVQNITVNAVFYLLQRPERTASVISAWFLVRWFRRVLARTGQPSGDLTPATIGKLSGVGISASMAAGHLTAIQPPLAPQFRAPPSMGQFVMTSEFQDPHRAVQENLRFERNKRAAQLASSENLGSPRVLLDQPRRM